MASGQLELKQNYEKVMTRKVQERLDRVVGPDRVNVAVNLELDIQKETRTREKKYSQPEGGKIIMTEKTMTEDTTESTPPAGGATGTESKLAGEPPAGQPGKTNKEDIDRQYAVNEEEIIVELNRVGYDGAINIEWEDNDVDRLAGARAALEAIRRADLPPSGLKHDEMLNA